ncbi:MAG: hypothetical protein ACKOF7_04670 [Phycisphaerales bacterium]
MVESFEPVSVADGMLTVRRSRAGGGAGTALQDMLATIASRAAGRPMRVRVEASAAAAVPSALPSSPPRPTVTLIAPARLREAEGASTSRPPSREERAPVAASDAAPAAAPARAEDDRAAATHPFVQQLADLFDARIVRIEAAGTLPSGSVPPADPAESADGADLPDHASDPDPADPGDR